MGPGLRVSVEHVLSVCLCVSLCFHMKVRG